MLGAAVRRGQEGIEVGEGAVEAGRALHLVLGQAVVGADLLGGRHRVQCEFLSVQRDPGGLAQGFVDLDLGCFTNLLGQ